jgi:hypothetical protein
MIDKPKPQSQLQLQSLTPSSLILHHGASEANPPHHDLSSNSTGLTPATGTTINTDLTNAVFGPDFFTRDIQPRDILVFPNDALAAAILRKILIDRVVLQIPGRELADDGPRCRGVSRRAET